MEGEMMSPEIRAVVTGLDPRYAKRLADALNVYLANLHVVTTKLRNFHWNVVGFDLFEFHEKLGELYAAVDMEIDEISERIRMLGFWPVASMHEFIRLASLKEAPSVPYPTPVISQAIVNDFAETARYLHEVDQFVRETTDEFTINLIASALGFLEKNIWFFSAYLGRLDEIDPQS
jgi:starvation-inducible DNA-binding protein